MMAMQQDSIPQKARQFEYFDLRTDRITLLPEGQQLVIDHLNEMIYLIEASAADWQHPRLLRAGTMFEDELRVVCPLLRAWPAPVAYESLLALVTGEASEEDYIRRLAQAREDADEAEFATILLPLRTQMDSCNERLAPFGLTILAESRGLLINAAAR